MYTYEGRAQVQTKKLNSGYIKILHGGDDPRKNPSKPERQ